MEGAVGEKKKKNKKKLTFVVWLGQAGPRAGWGEGTNRESGGSASESRSFESGVCRRVGKVRERER
jgi:hypothetical protein